MQKDDKTTTPITPDEPREKFIGTYSTKDTTYIVEPNIYTFNSYAMGIYKNSSDASKINIYNFNNSNDTIIATVSSSSFIVSYQTFGSSNQIIYMEVEALVIIN